MGKRKAVHLVLDGFSPSTADLCPRYLLIAALLHQQSEKIVGYQSCNHGKQEVTQQAKIMH